MLRTVSVSLFSRAFSTAARVNVTINGKKYETHANATILDVARQNNIYIPTLCYHPRLPHAGNCRLCLVQVNQQSKLVPACANKVYDGMNIATDSNEIRATVRGNLALIASNHDFQCATCEANGRCELQDLVARYKPHVNGRVLGNTHEFVKKHDDNSSDALARSMDLCVRCGRCVRACNSIQDMNILNFVGRGSETVPITNEKLPLDLTKCIECGQCGAYCPVGAIAEKSELHEVLDALENGPTRGKVVVVQTAPAVRVAVAEELNLAPGSANIGQMVAALRASGFHYVFDTTFGADLTIMEEGTELLQRLNSGKLEKIGFMATSCCPAWVTCVEKEYPEYIPNLSSARSPHQMQGSSLKTYFAKKLGIAPEKMIVVSIMPCTAKKHEAKRPEFYTNGIPDVDHVLTTRELGKLFRLKGIPLGSLKPEAFDAPMGIASGAGDIFGNSGGVLEAALRTAYELSTGKTLKNVVFSDLRGLKGIKDMVVPIQKADGTPVNLRVAVCNGIANARVLMEKIKKKEVAYDFVEVMACPGGCIGGGGQPKSHDPKIIEKRMAAVYTLDERNNIRKSHENPQVLQLYKEFFGQPCSQLAHDLLHTTYRDRSANSASKATASHGPEAEAVMKAARAAAHHH